MSRSLIIEEIEKKYRKKDIPAFRVGDTVRVKTRIKEGEKERIQAFSGTVVAKKGGGLSETFTLYRTAYGSNMDRVFLLHSPTIVSMEVLRLGKVRRSKLYYLRGRSGKAAKVKERYVGGKAIKESVETQASEPSEDVPPSSSENE